MTVAAAEQFTFDPEAHVYRLGPQRLLSVTDVLRDNGLINPDWYTEQARSRGKAVHHAVHLYNQGRLAWSTLHPDLHGYVWSWEKLQRRLELRVIDSEVPRFHPLYKYAGTLDLRVGVHGRECVWDLKTGPAPKWGCYQTAAYELLAPPYQRGLRQRAAVELQADGSMARLVPHLDFSDGPGFLTLLAVTRIRAALGIAKQNGGTYGNPTDASQ